MPNEMTMVERVAAEIAQASMTKRWQYLSGDVRQRYREMARAAIEAMRTPTHTMGLAGIKTGLIQKAIDEGAAHWQIDYPKMIFSAMIDAALKEREGEKG